MWNFKENAREGIRYFVGIKSSLLERLSYFLCNCDASSNLSGISREFILV
jgi:hypothetical protein